LLEKIVEYFVGGGSINGVPDYMATHFTWHRFAAIQIWIFVLFLIYTTAADLNMLFGQGELYKIFFKRRSSELKLSRRQRVRKLVELNRLTETSGAAQLGDPTTPAHAELVGLIKSLAAQDATA
jgi:hypothetical protein